jgi:hypothetical protein
VSTRSIKSFFLVLIAAYTSCALASQDPWGNDTDEEGLIDNVHKRKSISMEDLKLPKEEQKDAQLQFPNVQISKNEKLPIVCRITPKGMGSRKHVETDAPTFVISDADGYRKCSESGGAVGQGTPGQVNNPNIKSSSFPTTQPK